MLMLCQNDYSSQTGQNVKHLMNLYEIEDMRTLIKNKDVIKKVRVNPLEIGENWKPVILEELCLAQKGLISLDMNLEDIDMLIEVIATT